MKTSRQSESKRQRQQAARRRKRGKGSILPGRRAPVRGRGKGQKWSRARRAAFTQTLRRARAVLKNYPISLCVSFNGVLTLLAEAFTGPSYWHLVAVVVGIVLGFRRRTVTGIVASAGLWGLHHASFYRFFSQAVWSMDEVWALWAPVVIKLVPASEPICLAGDDTVARHTGGKIHGVGLFHDNRPGPTKAAAIRWGHNWVVLAVLVPLDAWGWAGRHVAVPVWAKLYRKEAHCDGESVVFRTKCELLVEMVRAFCACVPEGRAVWLFVDGGYSNGSVVQQLPAGVEVFGRVRADAELYGLPARRSKGRGRPRQRGRRVGSPQKLLAQRRGEWESMVTDRGHPVAFGKKVVLWWRVARQRPVSLVMVDCPHRRQGQEYFFTTVCDLSAREVCEQLERRWAIEVLFRDLKQHLGLETPQCRVRLAVERTGALLFLVGGLVHYWFLSLAPEERERLVQAYGPESLRGSTERAPSFAAKLRLLRVAIWEHRFKCNSFPVPNVAQKADALLRYLATAA